MLSVCGESLQGSGGFPRLAKAEAAFGRRVHPTRGFELEMDSAISVHSIVVATKDQVFCALGDEAAILNMKNSVYYGMNAVGASVWSLLQQPKRVRELRDAVMEEYDVDAEQCERDLLELLEKMRSEGLIEVRSAAAA
jgi:hypothetical protein